MSNPEVNSYEFTSLDELQKILRENGWNNDQVTRLIGTSWVKSPFGKITINKENIPELAKKLDAANTRYEQQNLLRQITMWKLISEVGETFSFATIDELKDALEQKGVSFPEKYLSQVDSFVKGFWGPRTLSKQEYEGLITALKVITGNRETDNADRWNLIRVAFKDVPKVISVEWAWEVDSMVLITLKSRLEREAWSPVTVDSIRKVLDALDGEKKNPDARAVIVSYLWSRLATAGYIMTLQGWKVVLQNTADQKNAEILAATMMAYIQAGKMSTAEVQRAILVGTGSFGMYLDIQKVNLKNISTEAYVQFLAATLNIDLKKWTPEQKVQLINKSSGTPDEKAFLISYVNGGYSWYNLVLDAERYAKICEQSKELIVSPQYAAVQAKVNTVSGGGIQSEKKRMADANEKLDWNSFLDNPMKAITKYPWTSLGIVIGSIWKFWFMKTLLGLLWGFVWYNVLKEWGLIDPLKTQEDPKKGIISMLQEIGISWAEIYGNGKPDKNGNIYTKDFSVWKRIFYIWIDKDWIISLKDVTTNPKSPKRVRLDWSTDSSADFVKTLDEAKAAIQKIQEKVTTTTPQKTLPENVPPAKWIDKSWIAGPRLAATERVEKYPELSNMVETLRKSNAQKKWVETADISDYVAFINTELQGRKISELINPSDYKASIFSDDVIFDKAWKNHLNWLMLKRVLRVYLGADMRTVDAQNNMKKWEKEQKAFMDKHKTVMDNQNSTLKDLIDSIK